mgnify:CR=1 FL=1
MNYGEKKCLSENEWLAKKLNKTEFFLLAQLKSCRSSDWTSAQKELGRFGLKIKLVSFKNFSNVLFFSKLELKNLEALFGGQTVLIYSDMEVKPSSSLIDFVRSLRSVRPFLFHQCGRLVNVDPNDSMKKTASFSFSEWSEVFNQLSGSSLCNTLSTFVDSHFELFQFQHRTLLNLLVHNGNKIKIENENKF